MRVLGIDPGLDGGLAVLHGMDKPWATPMPSTKGKRRELDLASLADWLRSEGDSFNLAVVEQVHAMPGQGVSSMFKFGCGYGSILGLLAAFRIPYETVTPQAWKKVVLAGTAKDKQAAIRFVQRRFPSLNLMPGRLQKPHDGMADAVCLASWGILRAGGVILFRGSE